MSNQNLPDGWKEKRLKDVGKCLAGLTYAPNDVTDESGLLVLRSSNVQGGKLVFDDNVFVKRDVKVTNYAQNGDILVCVRNGSRNLIGKNALITTDGEGLAHGAFMMLFRSNNNQYLYQLFSSEMYNKQVYKNLGATINSINSSDFYKFRFPFPALPEQKIIADLLSTWDEAIEKTEALIDAKERQFWWLQKSVLDDDFKSYGGHLSDYAGIMKQQKIEEVGDLKLLTVKLHCKGIEANERDVRITLSKKGRPYFQRFSGEFLIGRQNFHNGGFGIVPKQLNGFIASNAITTLEIDPSKLDPKYLFYFFSRKDYYLRIGHIMDGTGQKELSDKQIMKLPVSIPSIEKQKKVFVLLDTAQQEITLLKKLADQYRTQKRGLMQKLLSGEWHIKNKEAA